MVLTRSRFQGVWNIVRFNWHFYVLAGIGLLLVILFKGRLPVEWRMIASLIFLLTVVTTLVSLLVSYYVYDYSGLYKLDWLPDDIGGDVLNINAGFDETSLLLQDKFPEINLTICDFYDPKKHTEVSIKRARKIYPPPSQTIPVRTSSLPFPDHQFDHALAVLAAHEIRDEAERTQFFSELRRITKSTGRIYVLEHLRDSPNFLAYTIGFLHFYAKKTWLSTFRKADLRLENEEKITPFLSLFTLKPNGNTP